MYMSEQDLNKQNKEEQNLTSEQVSKTLEEAVNVPQKQPKAHVRTFAKDVAEQMRDNSTSVVKIALAEQNRQKEYETIVKSTKKQQIIFLSLTFVFIVGGAILLAFAMSSKHSDVPVPSLVSPKEKANSIIFSEQQEIVDVTDFSRAETIESILTNVNFVRDAGITNILTTVGSGASVRTMYGSEFLTRIATNIPETTVPLMGNNFMIGVDGNNNFTLFLIFSFDNFDGVVDGFREWEPFLVQDMNRMLKINTGGKSIEVFSKPFQSEILFNKESRVLRDENQGFVVGYTFLDRNNLVITTNIKTIEEVVKRFSVQEIK
jgi:hypothetical protein